MVSSDNLLSLYLDDESKQKLYQAAKEECEVAQVLCVNRTTTVAPLQISHQEDPVIAEQQDHFHRRDEIMEMINKPPVGNVSIENLFVNAKKLAEMSSSQQQFPTKRERDAYIDIHGNIVGITGQAGIGKTTVTKTIFKKVVNEGLYSPELVFYLTLRDLDYDVEADLLSLLTPSIDFFWKKHDSRRSAVLSAIAASSKTLIIMDGFDEATYDSLALTATHQMDLHQQGKPFTFIKHILQGKLLPKAKVLVTSRPKQLLELPKDLKQKFMANVLGLDKQAQKKICDNVCVENRDEIYDYIQNRPDISSLCFVPLNCILVMHTVQTIRSLKHHHFSHTLTSVFAVALGLFMSFPELDNMFDLEKFSRLAWIAFQENKFYLNESDLLKAGLQGDEQNAFLLPTRFNTKLTLLGGGTSSVHYFSHLLLQECLVATRLLFFATPPEFKKFFIGKPKLNCFKRFRPVYDLAANRFEIIAKFMYDFCNENTFSSLKEKFPTLVLSSEHVEMLQSFAMKRLSSCLKSHSYLQDTLPVFHWGFEFNNQVFSFKLARLLPSTIEFTGRFLPSDLCSIHHILRTKQSSVVISVFNCFVNLIGDGRQLFFRELKSTMESSRYVKVT